MQGIDLIQDFGILLLAAGLAGILCRRLGLSVIVGYLVAGMVIGPYIPPFSLISDEGRIMALSQVGLVFLMFAIGLGLSLSKFARLGGGTFFATVIGAFFVLLLTQIFGAFAGWSSLQSMFVASMLMVSSSAVIAKIVSELKLSHERASQTALAVTVLEDVVAVTMLTILAGQVQAGSSASSLGSLLAGLSAFVVLLVGAGLLLVPRLLRKLEARADPEMQTIIVAGLLFALALAAAKAGYSIALGAFLFGAIVAEIPQKKGVEVSFSGLRDLFSSVFFVSIGMMIDLRHIADVWPLVLGLTALALVARPIACSLALIIVGMAPNDAKRASLLLTPLGEFSFIIAQLGISSAILPESFYPVAVSASILTVLAAPLMARRRDSILRFVDRIQPRLVTNAVAAYHAWVVQLRERPTRMSVWTLLRPRFGQIALEALFISGLLIYSKELLAAIADSPFSTEFDETTLSYVFWGVIAVLVLVPLVSIWRNFAALALLLSQAWENTWLPRIAIESALKTVVAIFMVIWLYVVLPRASFSRWGWVVIGIGAAIAVTFFSRRLIRLHSEWHNTVTEVLADNRVNAGELRAEARANLGQDLDKWNVILAECTVPDAAPYIGKTLAELAIPSRFSCSVIEIGRNGHAISALPSEFALYAGDTLLLMGASDQVEAAQKFLETEVKADEVQGHDGAAVLDTCQVAGPRAGRTLGELQVTPQTGVRVVGIQRGDQRIVNPTADEKLHEGDDLLVLGTLPKIRRFRQWLVAGT